MFTDYTIEIIRFFEEKKAKNELSVYLQHPSPANLKKQWLLRYNDPCNRTDLYLLQSIIGRSQNERLHVSAIRMYETEKLKSLSLLLNKKIKSTSEKNIELLAYLLDFQIRPYNNYHRNKVDQKEAKIMLSSTKNDTKPTLMYNDSQFHIEKWHDERLEMRNDRNTTRLDESMSKRPKSDIVIEYPSGIKIHLDVSNVEYISQLVNK